jgi:CBS domain-containing protein
MAQTVREVMSNRVVTVPQTMSLAEAARRMREHDVGDVIVMDGERMSGMLTDRDIVVRAVALDLDPDVTIVDDVASHEIVSVAPETDVSDVVRLMRDHAVRRVPVVEDERPVGIVTIGDLAIERDSSTALADISAARPNR